MKKIPCSGVILAGGQNKRFAGKNKAFCKIDGQRIIDAVYSIFKDIFDDIILVTNNPMDYISRVDYINWNATLVKDVIPVRSSLTGIYTGLFYAANPYIFVSACDAPFLKKELIECIIDHITPNIHAVIPETSKGLEPLCAAYSGDSLNLMEKKIFQKKFKILPIFSKNRIKKIPESILREKDRDLISFFNVNTPEDLLLAKKLHEKNKGD